MPHPNLDALLSSIQSAALTKAASAFHASKDYSPANPTSIRLDHATLAFYDTLADKLGMSRNAVIQALLQQWVVGVVQKQEVAHS